MPSGKPAGKRCVQLDDADRCRLFADPARPAVCRSLRPAPDLCGDSREAALALLTAMEQSTAPVEAHRSTSIVKLSLPVLSKLVSTKSLTMAQK